jgi:hypothetical protein
LRQDVLPSGCQGSASTVSGTRATPSPRCPCLAARPHDPVDHDSLRAALIHEYKTQGADGKITHQLEVLVESHRQQGPMSQW